MLLLFKSNICTNLEEALDALESYQGKSNVKQSPIASATKSKSKKVATSESKKERKARNSNQKNNGLNSFCSPQQKQTSPKKREHIPGHLKYDDPQLVDDDYIEEPVGDSNVESPVNYNPATDDQEESEDRPQHAASTTGKTKAKDDEEGLKEGEHAIATTVISPRVSGLISVLGGVVKAEDEVKSDPITKSCAPQSKNNLSPQQNSRKRGRWLPLKPDIDTDEQDKKPAALHDNKMDDMYESALDNKSSKKTRTAEDEMDDMFEAAINNKSSKKKRAAKIISQHYKKLTASPEVSKRRAENGSSARVPSVTVSRIIDVSSQSSGSSEAHSLLARNHPGVSSLGMVAADLRGLNTLQNMAVDIPSQCEYEYVWCPFIACFTKFGS